MDNFDLLGVLLQNQQRGQEGTPLLGPSVSQTDPVAKMMYGEPEPSPFSGMGLVNATKTVTKRSPSSSGAPMSQADFLQKQLVAMEAEGIKQQQEGLKAYEEQAKNFMQNQGVNPWQAVAAGLSDFFNGSKNLEKISQQQQAQKANNLAIQEKLQGARSDITKNQTGLIKTQLDYERAKEKNAADEERTRLMFGLARDKFNKKGFTPGQEAADKDFGKEYSDWNQKGGRDGYVKNKAALEFAINELENDPTLTGGAVGLTPDSILPIVHGKTAEVEQKVKAAVLGAVKQLGANPTDTDLKEIYKSVWDKKLSPAQNASKIRAELQRLDAQAQAKDEASRYFEQTGSLVGQGAATKRPAAGGGLTPEQEARRQELLRKKNGG